MAVHELLNLLACLVVLWWLLLIAVRLSNKGHRAAQVLTILLAGFAGWEAIGPFFASLEHVSISTAILHALFAVASVLGRRPLIGMIDGAWPPRDRPARRSTDPKGNGAHG